MDDGPAVLGADLEAVGLHGREAVRDDVEHLTVGVLEDVRLVVARQLVVVVVLGFLDE